MFLDDDFNDLYKMICNKFNRGVKDMSPSMIKKVDDDRYIISVNTLGVDVDDLHVEIIPDINGRPILKVYGTTKAPELVGTSYNVEIQLALYFTRPIETKYFECKNGMTYVYIKLAKDNTLPSTNVDRIPTDGDWNF